MYKIQVQADDGVWRGVRGGDGSILTFDTEDAARARLAEFYPFPGQKDKYTGGRGARVLRIGAKKIINPFIPNQPVRPGMFVGRGSEIGELEAALTHTKHGSPRHFLITGERGIGKTSFLDYIRSTARSSSADGESHFNFVVIDLTIDRLTSKLDLVKRTELALEHELAKTEPARTFLRNAWDFLRRIEAAGIKHRDPDYVAQSEAILYDKFGYALIQIAQRLCVPGGPDALLSTGGYDGILILLDEADQASPELDLGKFLKYLLEFLRRNECNQIVFGVAGLPSVVDVLLKSHPSSLRIFDELGLANLGKDEVDELLGGAIVSVRGQDEDFEKFDITEDGREAIWKYSLGHPHHVHQFGYCAIEHTSAFALSIDRNAVDRGAAAPRGAFDVIGDVYFADTWERLRVDKLDAGFLRELASRPSSFFPVEELLNNLRIDAALAQASLARLKESRLIICDPIRNAYKLAHPVFGYWLSLRVPDSVG